MSGRMLVWRGENMYPFRVLGADGNRGGTTSAPFWAARIWITSLRIRSSCVFWICIADLLFDFWGVCWASIFCLNHGNVRLKYLVVKISEIGDKLGLLILVWDTNKVCTTLSGLLFLVDKCEYVGCVLVFKFPFSVPDFRKILYITSNYWVQPVRTFFISENKSAIFVELRLIQRDFFVLDFFWFKFCFPPMVASKSSRTVPIWSFKVEPLNLSRHQNGIGFEWKRSEPPQQSGALFALLFCPTPPPLCRPILREDGTSYAN